MPWLSCRDDAGSGSRLWTMSTGTNAEKRRVAIETEARKGDGRQPALLFSSFVFCSIRHGPAESVELPELADTSSTSRTDPTFPISSAAGRASPFQAVSFKSPTFSRVWSPSSTLEVPQSRVLFVWNTRIPLQLSVHPSCKCTGSHRKHTKAPSPSLSLPSNAPFLFQSLSSVFCLLATVRVRVPVPVSSMSFPVRLSVSPSVRPREDTGAQKMDLCRPTCVFKCAMDAMSMDDHG